MSTDSGIPQFSSLTACMHIDQKQRISAMTLVAQIIRSERRGPSKGPLSPGQIDTDLNVRDLYFLAQYVIDGQDPWVRIELKNFDEDEQPGEGSVGNSWEEDMSPTPEEAETVPDVTASVAMTSSGARVVSINDALSRVGQDPVDLEVPTVEGEARPRELVEGFGPEGALIDQSAPHQHQDGKWYQWQPSPGETSRGVCVETSAPEDPF